MAREKNTLKEHSRLKHTPSSLIALHHSGEALTLAPVLAGWAAACSGRLSFTRGKHGEGKTLSQFTSSWSSAETQRKVGRSGRDNGIWPLLWEFVISTCLSKQAWIFSRDLILLPRLSFMFCSFLKSVRQGSRKPWTSETWLLLFSSVSHIPFWSLVGSDSLRLSGGQGVCASCRFLPVVPSLHLYVYGCQYCRSKTHRSQSLSSCRLRWALGTFNSHEFRLLCTALGWAWSCLSGFMKLPYMSIFAWQMLAGHHWNRVFSVVHFNLMGD